MISVLLPSRGRPAMLIKSVDSLNDTAAEAPEILVAVDTDDEHTVNVAHDLVEQGLVSGLAVFVRHGYEHLYRYYNDLAKLSSGEWLLLWNDDATMMTPQWDRHIEKLPPEALVADLQHDLSPEFVCFPAMRRNLYDVLGHFTRDTPHCDSYLQDLARSLGRVRPVDVYVAHDRPDISGREPDATYTEGRAGLRHTEYFAPAMQALIASDIEKVRESGI